MTMTVVKLQHIALLCLCLTGCRGFQYSPFMSQLSDKYFSKEGDLNLGAVYHITEFSKNDQRLCGTGFSYLPLHFNPYIMQFEIESINKRQDILPNITLGYVVLDDCEGQIPAVPRFLQLLPLTNTERCSMDESLTFGKNFDVVGILGPTSSLSSTVLATMAAFFQVPQIGAFASSDALSDRQAYPYFYRLIPPDQFQAKATVDAIKEMGWEYFSLVYVEEDFGFNGNKNVRLRAETVGVCLEESYPVALGTSVEEYKKLLLSQMTANKKAKVVVVYLFPTMIRKLLTAYKQLLNEGELKFTLTWILPECFPWGMARGVADALVGSIQLNHPRSQIPNFFEHYESLTPWTDGIDPWFSMVWEQALGCSFDNSSSVKPSCRNFKSISESPMYFPDNILFRWGDAVHVYAHAIDALIRDRCPDAFVEKSKLRTCVKPWLLGEYIQNVKIARRDELIEFNENGDWLRRYVFLQNQFNKKSQRYGMVEIGTYETSTDVLTLNKEAFMWDKNDTKEPPESVCAYPCGIGEISIQGEVICCWECRPCRDNEIVAENGTKCHLCPPLFWPDSTFSECLPIEPTYLDWTNVYGICLIGLGFLALVASCVVVVLVIKHRNRRVIKGASPDMLGVILLGCIMSCLTIPVFILKPIDLWCILSRTGFCLSSNLIFVPLLIKTMRIYRVFSASARLETTVYLVSRTAINLQVLILITIQIIVVVVLGIIIPTQARFSMPIRSEKYVELECNLNMYGIMIPLGYNIFIIVCCSIFGLMARKLPDNFNESWYIFVTVCTTLFIWISFIPIYFAAFYAYHKAVLLALSMFLNILIILLCLFGPKVYALYYIADKDIKVTDFKNPLSTTTDNTDSRSSFNTQKTKIKD